MIKISSLCKSYGRGRKAVRVLHDLSFTLPDTGFVCILGPSGCGKTSLLNAIGGLDRFDSGSVSCGEDSGSFGYIFQNYYLLSDHSVAYNVYMGLHDLELDHKEKLCRVREALRAVEMEEFLRRKVGELSGGQQQRVAIARAIARKPRVIFADEPTGNLDEANTLNICSILRRISKTSLVLMVTHEERIASFFADRIIRLDQGRIASDSHSFDRSSMDKGDGRSLYSGDYECSRLSAEGVNLRLLREKGAEPVELTVLALSDRVVIKLADSRSVSCGSPEQNPCLVEGSRPSLSLEELDSSGGESPLFVPGRDKACRPGRGLRPGMMLSEARRLASSGGAKKAGLVVFLLLLSLLCAFTLADHIALAQVDPEDFIVTDSHILEVRIDQGTVMYADGSSFTPVLEQYLDWLRQSGLELSFVPHVSQSIEYSHDIFAQMDAISMNFGAFSYVPAQALDESSLICGRAPQRSDEIVVDRWILERAMAQDGILQSSIADVEYFLGKQLSFLRQSYAPTIVGICDSGEPSIYIPTAGLISIGVNGTAVTPLSELRRVCPGEYEDLSLGPRECLVVTNNAGGNYRSGVGQVYLPSRSFVITQAIEAPVYGNIVVDDGSLEDMLWGMYSDRFYVYCADKQAAKAALEAGNSPVEQEGWAIVTVIDRHSDSMESYEKAAGKRLDGRAIVSYTVLALCAAMLWLLCRSRAYGRLEMLSVYRLLGIPGGRIAALFALESLILSFSTALPALALAWLGINVGALLPQLELSLSLPAGAAAACFGGITLLHLLACLAPLGRLLRLPPAVLAARYDM